MAIFWLLTWNIPCRTHLHVSAQLLAATRSCPSVWEHLPPLCVNHPKIILGKGGLYKSDFYLLMRQGLDPHPRMTIYCFCIFSLILSSFLCPHFMKFSVLIWYLCPFMYCLQLCFLVFLPISFSSATLGSAGSCFIYHYLIIQGFF